ncbi:hypothetical protein [Ammoniphilus sp. YIM 78166]|uniref:hypothetical protein n=1 Tax=Ammoniphilus sp. YIM 78166 TaxID=1644106 RepID=UPI00106FF993|nr:hypothetical protein [Ammoniphilus sp. YIM 78166]
MIFWNVGKLAEQIKQGDLSSKQKVKYLIVVFVFLGITPYAYLGEAYSSAYGLEVLVVLFATIWGILYCHEANEEGDGKDFFERFICIGVPVGVRIMVFSLPFYLILSSLFAFFTPIEYDTAFQYDYGDVLFTVIIEVVFYLQVRKWICFISTPQKTNVE